MNEYIDILLTINIKTGEVEDMVVKKTDTSHTMKEIYELYNKLNINYKNIKSNNEYEKYTKYNYEERSTLGNNTHARIKGEY